MTKEKELESLLVQYRTLGIDRQLDYEKFYLYSIITHSTAIEGSTKPKLRSIYILHLKSKLSHSRAGGGQCSDMRWRVCQSYEVEARR